jgi:hypothetical protein
MERFERGDIEFAIEEARSRVAEHGFVEISADRDIKIGQLWFNIAHKNDGLNLNYPWIVSAVNPLVLLSRHGGGHTDSDSIDNPWLREHMDFSGVYVKRVLCPVCETDPPERPDYLCRKCRYGA